MVRHGTIFAAIFSSSFVELFCFSYRIYLLGVRNHANTQTVAASWARTVLPTLTQAQFAQTAGTGNTVWCATIGEIEAIFSETDM